MMNWIKANSAGWPLFTGGIALLLLIGYIAKRRDRAEMLPLGFLAVLAIVTLVVYHQADVARFWTFDLRRWSAMSLTALLGSAIPLGLTTTVISSGIGRENRITRVLTGAAIVGVLGIPLTSYVARFTTSLLFGP